MNIEEAIIPPVMKNLTSLWEKFGPPGSSRKSGASLVFLFFFLFSSWVLSAQQIESLMQGANGPADQPSDPVTWIRGNLNSTKGHFVEGMSIPYRLEITDLDPGQTYCITIGWDTKANGAHAIDFLTSYDRNEGHELFGHPAEEIDVLAGSSLEGRELEPERLPLPAPASADSPVAGQPAAAFNALAETDRELAIFNGIIISYGYVGEDPLDGANAASSLEICFRLANGAAVNSVLIAWGGHIATQETWGEGNAALTGQGNPYRAYVEDCGAVNGCGNRTLTVQAAAVAEGGDCGISGPSTMCSFSTATFTALAPEDASLSWTLVSNNVGARIEGPRNQRTVRVRAREASGYFELQLRVDGVLLCTKSFYIFGLESLSLLPETQELCLGVEPEPVTWSGLPEEEGVITTLILTDKQGNELATAPDGESLLALLPDGPGDYLIYGVASLDTDAACRLDTDPVRLFIKPVPEPAFEMTPACFGSPVEFTDRSTISSGSIVNQAWNFGDNKVAVSPNPEHLYEAPGPYTVTLRVRSDLGCSAITSREVVVTEPPEADFSAFPVCEEEALEFFNTSTAGGAELTAFEWQFGDGQGSREPGPVHIYEEGGIYSVQLTVTDANGCTDTHEEDLQIYVKPSAAFRTESVCLGNPSTFTQLSEPGDGEILTYEWDFGDETGSSDPAPVHTYEQAGNYTVTLRVSDALGCTDTYEATAKVFSPLQVEAGPDATVCQGEPVQLQGQSAPGATPAVWSDNGIGGNFSPSADNLDATYTPPADFVGEAILTLTTNDPVNPCPIVSDEVTISVLSAPPVNFAAPAVCFPAPVEFSISSSMENVDGIAWDFAGLDTDNTASPSYSFPEPGAYEVTLTVTYTSGCVVITTKTVNVFPTPAAGFTVDPVCAGDPSVFVDRSAGNITSYNWNFGDNSASAASSPVRLYEKPGAYTVELRVSNIYGCSDEVSKEAIVRTTPIAGFTAGSSCEGESIQFTNTSTPGDSENLTYEWRFGDEQSSLLSDPTHTYAQPGKYLVSLRITDGNGCTDTYEEEIQIYANPRAAFETETVCLGTPTPFYQASEPGDGAIISYEWDFGDGTGSTSPNPGHLYEQPGRYTVTLTVTGDLGCSDVATREVVVYDTPEAGFIAESFCEGEAVQFTNTSTAGDAGILLYEWQFGDGQGRLEANPGHTYAQPGVYEVTLSITDANGCTDTYKEEIQVYAKPEADFQSENVCLGTPTPFYQFSEAGDGDIVSYQWDFGDGTSSTERSPRHTYQEAGDWPVTLTVTDDNSCTDVYEAFVKVFAPPAVEAGDEAAICQGESLQLDGQMGAGVTGATWSDGGLGGSFSPGARILDAVYTPPTGFSGEVNLRLTSDDPSGPCSAVSDELILRVLPVATAAAGPDAMICRDQSLALNGRIGGAATSAVWSDNGAGGTFLPGPGALDATYQAPAGYTGDITLSLTTNDPAGPCPPANDELLLTVLPPVEVDAGADDAICENGSFALDGRISGGVNTGAWSDGGAGGTFIPNAGALNAAYLPPQDFQGQITLTLNSDAPGGPCPAASDELILTVNPTPLIDFEAPAACYPSPVDFSITGSTEDVTSVRWDFAGLGADNSLAPSFRFPEPGTYPVKLTLRNKNGCSAELIKNVSVFPRPVPDFRVETNCPGQALQFQNTSQIPDGLNAGYAWDFGDGTTSTAEHPAHIYSGGKSYMVRLQVTDERGCSATIAQEVTLRDLPKASFTADPVCAGEMMQFINTSDGNAAALTDYYWDFGDGNTSTAANPAHVFNQSGFYQVELTVEDNNGCRGTVVQEVEVYALPKPSFTVETNCEGAAVRFTGTSGDNPVTHDWDFGDGNTSDLANPEHIYASAGAYTVVLTTTNSEGCSNSTEQEVIVGVPPRAAFSATEACTGEAVTFTNNSRPGSTPLKRYEWQFGDGTRSTLESPQHAYVEAGRYDVVLTVFDEAGCSHSFIGEVTVDARPEPGFTTDIFCESKTIQFNNTSTTPGGGIVSYQWDFGDGEGSVEESPSHVFDRAGSHTIVLTVSNDKGCSRTLEQVVNIPLSPVAGFSVSDVCETDGADIQLVNQSTPAEGGSTAGLTYLWILRDERQREVARSREENPAFDLPPGVYEVELTVNEGPGCSGVATKEVTIYPDPAVIVSADAERVCEGESAILRAVLSGGADCRPLQWQRSDAPGGPWNIITGAEALEYEIPADLPQGTYYFRARYRCNGLNCNTAVSEAIGIEVGAGGANLGCNNQVNITLQQDCRTVVKPALVAQGNFGHCFPYRAEDFEVIVYDGIYPNGEPDNVVEDWGLFSYTLRLKAEAVEGGGVFEPCWGDLLVVDATGPGLSCPDDVTGLIRSGQDYRPANGPEEAGGGEAFNYLLCSELTNIYQEERSWKEPEYAYYTGFPEAVDACGSATLLRVEDQRVDYNCEETSLAFGGQLSAKIVRTFTFTDESGNESSCDQNIYFFRPNIYLPDCETTLDLCVYGDDTALDPGLTGSAPYYFNALGDSLSLLNFTCGFSVRYDDQFFAGPPNCGFKIRRTWSILDECRSQGFAADLVRGPAGCAQDISWSGDKLTFVQDLVVADNRAPLLSCPAPAEGETELVFPTGPFNCTAVINAPAPQVEGECQDWSWYFEVYGYVVDPFTNIPEYRLIGRSQDQLLSGVPTGEYDLVYTVTDACGNQSVSDPCPIRVVDRINPIAICDDELTVGLGSGDGNANGVASVRAADIGENSRDNCGEVSMAVRRRIGSDCLDAYVRAVLDPGKGFADLEERNGAGDIVEYYFNDVLVIERESETYWSAWGASVFMTCCDVTLTEADRVLVEFRVTDRAGNSNICESLVTVEDNLAPRCSVTDQVIACTDFDFDPEDSGQVAARFGAPEEVVTVFDNCGASISEELLWTPASCGRGTLERLFTVTDAAGQTTFCTQTITVEEVNDYEIRFPADAEAAVCGEVISDDVLTETFGCDLLAISRDTVDFRPPGSVCLQLMITYDVINWCEYNGAGSTTPTRIPRDIDGDEVVAEPTWVRVAYDAQYDAVVAKIYAADDAGNRKATPERVLKPGDSGYNPGYYQYLQFVNFVDDQAPEVQVYTENLSFCSFDGADEGCSGSFEIQLGARDECSFNTVELMEVTLSDAGGTIPAGSDTYQVSKEEGLYILRGSLPIGDYQFALRFSDGCGNFASRTIDFEIADCKSPAPVCKGVFSTDLAPVDTDDDGRVDAGEVIIPVLSLLAGDVTDCSPFPDEPVRQVKYFVSRSIPQTVDDLTDQTITMTCADEGLVTEVFVTALDAAGNFDYCSTRIFVDSGSDPSPCNLPSGEGVISGLINTEDEDPVEGVNVRLSGPTSESVMTDLNGMYEFQFLETGYDYSVAAELDANHVNGVTTFDLLLINKHILNEELLSSPYKLIAADANNDKRITTLDLIQLRKLVLTMITELPDNTSWRFVDAAYVFPDPADPWKESFPEILNINDLALIEDNGNFVAVKIGDVNGNAQTTSLAEPEVRSSTAFELTTEDQHLQPGNLYAIPIRASDLPSAAGFQFTLEIKPDLAEIAEIQEGVLRADNLAVFAESVITGSWYRPSLLSAEAVAEEPLFTLLLRPRREADLHEVLWISSRMTRAEAYFPDGEAMEVELTFSGAVTESRPFELYPNRPNPWRNETIIAFHLPAAGRASIRIADINGRTLQQIVRDFPEGYNEVRIDKDGLPSGVLYYVLESDRHTATRKMLRLE